MTPPRCVLLALLLAHFVSWCAADSQDWWKNAVFYQIYPKSFKDDDNDGMGDLRGIISKLPHLKDAGVTAAWLSPIYKSPQVDAGYDISDYKDVHNEFGTLDDFDELVRTADELGIKIVMDFVPNHSSDQHEWFNKSRNREENYEDYYVWHDAVNGTVPNNWISVFKGPAWKFDSERQQYYFHQFAKEQPDLNFNNPRVVQEFLDILEFWMDRGVYGFRIDAVKHLFETGFEDEPLSHAPNVQDFEYDYLQHIYTTDQPETFQMVYKWREFVDNYTATHGGDARIIMTEVYSDMENTMKYYGDGTTIGAHFTFNFNLITDLVSTSSARDIVMSVKRWLTYMPHEFVANWVAGNHDKNRVATRMGKQNVDGFNMMLALLPGVAVTYNGEEIGMEDGEVTWEQGDDPNACTGDPADFDKLSRDFERTPFHWDGTVNAGFNTGHETWLPVSSKYLTNNLAGQSQEGTWSHYRVYQAALKLRSTEALVNGRLDIEPYSDSVIVLRRSLRDEDAYVLVFNAGGQRETVDLTKIFDVTSEQLRVLIPSSASTKKIGDLLDPSQIGIEAHEGLVLLDPKQEGSGSISPVASYSLVFVVAVSLLTQTFPINSM